MTMMRPLVAAMAIAAMTSHAAHAEPRTVKLSDVLNTAVQQNTDLESASIDVATADARVLEASGIDDWQLSMSGTMFVARLGGAITAVSASAQDVVELSASVSKTLRSGGTLRLSASSRYNKSIFDFASGAANVGYSGGFDVTYTQPLLRGHGERFARANIARARIARTASQRLRHAMSISVVRDVIIAYWELTYAQRALAIRRGSLDLAKERLRITKAGIKAGSIAQIEALAVEQVIATRQEQILAAELDVTRRSLEVRRLAGLKIAPGHIDLTTSAPVAVKPQSFDFKRLLAYAYQRSPEIAALKDLKKGAMLDVEVTRNGLLPRLDLSLSFGPAGVSNNPRSAFKQATKLDGYTAGVTLTYQQSLGRTATRGALRRVRMGLTKARLDLVSTRMLLASTLALTIKIAEVAAGRMNTSTRAIKLAEQNIKAEKSRFDLGRSTNFDIMQRQEELQLAQLRFARATIDYINAITLLDAATGDLLPRYGIRLHNRP